MCAVSNLVAQKALVQVVVNIAKLPSYKSIRIIYEAAKPRVDCVNQHITRSIQAPRRNVQHAYVTGNGIVLKSYLLAVPQMKGAR